MSGQCGCTSGCPSGRPPRSGRLREDLDYGLVRRDLDFTLAIRRPLASSTSAPSRQRCRDSPSSRARTIEAGSCRSGVACSATTHGRTVPINTSSIHTGGWRRSGSKRWASCGPMVPGPILLVVWVPWDQAESRVAARVAACGRVVRQNGEELSWSLVDPVGNEVDIAATSAQPWPRRTGRRRRPVQVSAARPRFVYLRHGPRWRLGPRTAAGRVAPGCRVAEPRTLRSRDFTSGSSRLPMGWARWRAGCSG